MLKIENKSSVHDIYVYDEIQDDLSKELIKKLDKTNRSDTLSFHCNTPGGSYFSVVSILSWLKNWTGQKIAYVEGLAASAGSYLLTGMDLVYAYPQSLFMLHKTQTQAYGNSDQFRKLADDLDKVNAGLIEAYRRKTGQSLEIVQTWLKDETWFDAKEALEINLVDHIIDQNLKNCCFKFDNVDYSKKRIELLVDKLNRKYASFRSN